MRAADDLIGGSHFFCGNSIFLRRLRIRLYFIFDGAENQIISRSFAFEKEFGSIRKINGGIARFVQCRRICIFEQEFRKSE